MAKRRLVTGTSQPYGGWLPCRWRRVAAAALARFGCAVEPLNGGPLLRGGSDEPRAGAVRRVVLDLARPGRCSVTVIFR
ncbi:hypothetical protein LT493_39640 [Streptomyces tricolor]|nr:hypothetical protein [Streptomyces tricolor]